MAGKSKGNTAAAVRKLCEPIAAGLGLRLWDVRLEKEGALWYLRIYIDKDGGVTLDDCEAMSRAADGPIDLLDPVEQSYFLEVCSPGIERELRRPEHFAQMAGREVCVVFFRPIDGEKEVVGELAGLDTGGDEKEIVLRDLDGAEFRIPHKLAAKVHVVDQLIIDNEE